MEKVVESRKDPTQLVFFGLFGLSKFQCKTPSWNSCAEFPFTFREHSVEVLVEEMKPIVLVEWEFENLKKVNTNRTFWQFRSIMIPMQNVKVKLCPLPNWKRLIETLTEEMKLMVSHGMEFDERQKSIPLLRPFGTKRLRQNDDTAEMLCVLLRP